MQPWIAAYLILAMRLDRLVRQHDFWLVDAYYGPQELADQVKDETLASPRDLISDCDNLEAALSSQGFSAARIQVLAANLVALRTVARRLNGDPLPWQQEVQQCLGVEPFWLPEADLESWKALYERGLPATGSLATRYQIWTRREQPAMADAKGLISIAHHILKELRARTSAFLPLPAGEGIELEVVHGKPYGAANWYLGGYRSRLELSAGHERSLVAVIRILSHEAYPGHHSEFSLREANQVRGLGFWEQSLMISLSPQLVIMEGIAEAGLASLFGPQELAGWAQKEIYVPLGLECEDIDLPMLFDATNHLGLDQLGGNLVMLLEDGAGEREAIDYILRYTPYSESHAWPKVASLRSPFSRIYAWAYPAGKRLIAPLLRTDEAAEWYRRLVQEPILPGWIPGPKENLPL